MKRHTRKSIEKLLLWLLAATALAAAAYVINRDVTGTAPCCVPPELGDLDSRPERVD